MEILTKLLGERPEETFLPKHFTRLPFSKTHGAQEFRGLISWEEIQKMIDGKKSVLRIVRDGMVVKDYAELNFPEAKKFYDQGSTLLVRFAERSSQKLKEVAQDFERSFHTPVDIQLYCTPDQRNAFGWHYDVEEVFIIQVKGSKAYSIRPNTIHPNPLVESIPKDLGYEKEKTPIEIKVTLEEGDWLYIPSGWWHRALTQRESMHISIGLMPSSAVDIAKFLPIYLAKNAFWRTRMPVHQSWENEKEETLFYQEAMGKLGGELSKTLASEDFIQEFLKWKRSRCS
jgi:50S ribosomal protein L16 3-hydroxylase